MADRHLAAAQKRSQALVRQRLDHGPVVARATIHTTLYADGLVRREVSKKTSRTGHYTFGALDPSTWDGDVLDELHRHVVLAAQDWVLDPEYGLWLG